MSNDTARERAARPLLSGRTAIVTGASSGIGRATALTLAQAGVAVVMQARRAEKLQKVADEISSLGGKALAVVGDAGMQKDIDLLLEQTCSWKEGGGKFDIVVVNAGRGLAGGILNSDETKWQELYQTNVLGAARLLRRAGLYLSQQKCGDLVVIGSVVGRNISPFSGFYGSSKFAVGAMVESLRREICDSGVRVSLVMPGIVTSGFQTVAGYDEENFGKSIAHYGELLQPQAIADAISWLLSLPANVNVSEITVRPLGQNYP